MGLNDRPPWEQIEPEIKYRLGWFHARLTAKGGGVIGESLCYPVDCCGVSTDEHTMGAQVPHHEP